VKLSAAKGDHSTPQSKSPTIACSQRGDRSRVEFFVAAQ
jgi:hypothetical protein